MTRTFTYTYRLIQIEEWQTGEVIYDDGPGSFRHTDMIENHRREYIITTWHDEDEHFGLYLLLSGELDHYTDDTESCYEVERRTEDGHDWEYVMTPSWQERKSSVLPYGYTDINRWLDDYGHGTYELGPRCMSCEGPDIKNKYVCDTCERMYDEASSSYESLDTVPVQSLGIWNQLHHAKVWLMNVLFRLIRR